MVMRRGRSTSGTVRVRTHLRFNVFLGHFALLGPHRWTTVAKAGRLCSVGER